MSDKTSIEIEGKTVEAAIKMALKELKLPRHKVKIKILSEEKRGLFGMPGAKPAKIRVTIIKDSAKGGSLSVRQAGVCGRKENT